MTQFNSPMDILKLLDKSNCRQCKKPTCLAFASAVYRGQSKLSECPNLEKEVIEQYSEYFSTRMSTEQLGDTLMEELKKQITEIDLASAAQRLGTKYSNGKITIQCLGKDFSVDKEGNIITDIHVNPWITIVVFTYIMEGAGTPVSGEWVTFRELDGSENRYPLFEQRCEKPLKKVADTYTGLFEDMLHIFSGKQVEYHYPTDISILLYPLPKVPMMIYYSKPEDDLDSNLALFFDSTIVQNLSVDCAFTLGVGLTLMFGKIAQRHGK